MRCNIGKECILYDVFYVIIALSWNWIELFLWYGFNKNVFAQQGQLVKQQVIMGTY